MAYEQRDMTGSLFKNDRKEADNHPDYKGSALIGGVDHWLDAWINKDRNGNSYMSLKLKPKEQRQDNRSGGGQPRQQAGAFDDDSSDIPFLSADPALEYQVR